MNPLPEVLAGRLLVGPALGWPYGDDPAAATRFLQVASRHGVQALLHQRLRRGEVWPSWPAKVRDTLSGARAAEITREHLRHGELLTVLEAMARRGLSPLLLKGAALAHTHYVTPELRRRGDTDMLIRPRERIVAREVLRDLGYQPLNLTSGSFVSYQFSVSKVDALGLQHAVDVHWRLSNRQVFGDDTVVRRVGRRCCLGRRPGCASPGAGSCAAARVHASGDPLRRPVLLEWDGDLRRPAHLAL